MKKNKIEYSVVIPIYNSEKTLSELIRRLHKTFTSISARYEVVLVDDGSQDKSWEILEKLHKKDKKIKAIQMMRNFGQHTTLMCGFKFIKGDYIITMDDDLQHPPEEIPKLIKAIKSNPEVDFVIGRAKEKKHSFIQNLGSNFINALYKKTFSIPKDIRSGPFRIIRKEIVEKIIKNKSKNPSVSAILFSISKKAANVPFKHKKRHYGKSGYDFSKQIALFYNSVLKYTEIPIKIVSFIGLGSSVLGIIFSIFYLGLFFTGKIKVTGWITIILLLLFFPGLILFSIGIIGEYLFRILREVNHSPRYFIRKKLL